MSDDYVEPSSFLSCFARPVGQKEIDRTPAAQKCVRTEWEGFCDRRVFDLASVREMSSVLAEARASQSAVGFGTLANIVNQEDSEVALGNPKREFTVETVFLGDRRRTRGALSCRVSGFSLHRHRR